MNVLVVGASGTVGRHLVIQALAEGHQVTAFARRPEALGIQHAELTLSAGDVLDSATVLDVVCGHDAVIVALGSGRKGGVRAQGTKHVIEAMKAHKVRRLVCHSTLGAGDSRRNLNFFWRYLMFGMLLRAAYADHEAQENLVRTSGLDWVIVRPAAFTDGPATGTYKHGFSPAERDLTLKISRADVAGFMLRQLFEETYLGRTPGLSY